MAWGLANASSGLTYAIAALEDARLVTEAAAARVAPETT